MNYTRGLQNIFADFCRAFDLLTFSRATYVDTTKNKNTEGIIHQHD